MVYKCSFLGYVAEGGVTRQPYGGHRVAEALKGALTERKYHFFTEAEYSLVRLIMEKVRKISEMKIPFILDFTILAKYVGIN